MDSCPHPAPRFGQEKKNAKEGGEGHAAQQEAGGRVGEEVEEGASGENGGVLIGRFRHQPPYGWTNEEADAPAAAHEGESAGDTWQVSRLLHKVDWILPTFARGRGGGPHPLAWLDESQSSGMMLGDDVRRDGRKGQKEAKGEAKGVNVNGDIGKSLGWAAGLEA